MWMTGENKKNNDEKIKNLKTNDLEIKLNPKEHCK